MLLVRGVSRWPLDVLAFGAQRERGGLGFHERIELIGEANGFGLFAIVESPAELADSLGQVRLPSQVCRRLVEKFDDERHLRPSGDGSELDVSPTAAAPFLAS